MSVSNLPDPRHYRRPDHPIDPIFYLRWSPRAMSGEPITDAELHLLLEAARWAPSTYNEQEWRFLYARRDGPHWQSFLDLLVPANQVWARRAAVLMILVARRVFSRNGQPNPVYALDAGAAWENLALQGSHMGLVVHGMAGIEYDKARQVLRVPEEYEVMCGIAVGRPGRIETLPPELAERETPSGRLPVREIACEGPFAL